MPTRASSKSPFDPLMTALEAAAPLDGPANLVAGGVRKALAAGAVKQAVSGTWLGHALHPALTDVVVGSLLSATAVDALAGKAGRTAAERLIMLGIAAYGPTAIAGASDWADAAADERVARVGLAHAGGNLIGLALYGGSLRARRRGHHVRGPLLGAAGAAVMMGGAYLGGHLSLRRGIGPDQTVYDEGPDAWQPAIAADELEEGRPVRAVVGDTPVLLLKHAATIHAIHDRCSHRGCSLAEGKIEGHEVVCGCHSSRFDLRDGSLLSGPATAPQPAFAVRLSEGRVEVRRQGSG